MRTHESEEMYLETILLLRDKKANVRSVDIVEELDYAKSSVSRAVNLLARKKYIQIDESGNITLTQAGYLKASAIYERHKVITKLLEMIGADGELAESNACRIEHVITDELFALVKEYVKKTEE